MKTLFFTLILMMTSLATNATPHSAERRSNALLRFIAERQAVKDFALQSVLGTRCHRYMNEEGRGPCKDAVKKMLEILDYDIIFDEKIIRDQDRWTPSSFVFVAFKKNLISLLNSPITTQYLNDLNQQLYSYFLGVTDKMNVWEVTKAHYHSPYMTSLVMASLFQDTSLMKLHLAYLDRATTPATPNFVTNRELLGRVIDTINLILDSSEEHYRELFYPKEIEKDLNRNIYHFYVPLYLSQTLKKEGIQDQYAFVAPLMLTLTYEFVTASKDYRYIFADPERIELLSKIKDIFAGFSGANIGVRGLEYNKSFEMVRGSFERSTEDGVKLLLQ